MSKKEIIEKTKKYVRQKLEGEGSGHDWWHTWRVWQTAKRLAKEEKADMFVVELAALLHDLEDWKFRKIETGELYLTKKWLKKMKIRSKSVKHMIGIINNISFKGSGVKREVKSLGGMIVQDADRLDAIGAIGIGRTFAFDGAKGREMYNPGIKPQAHTSFEQYKASQSPTINHFYEKLLLLKGLMNTATGKTVAEERHRFMEEFLDRFFKEWEGKL